MELCHFTSIENLPLIRRMNGLCPKQVLEDAGVWSECDPGGNTLSHQLDRTNDNWKRIALNFTPRTPMSYHKKREKHLCFFKLNPVVATIAGVLFTDTNATRRTGGGHQRAEGLPGLGLVNFESIRAFPRPGDREGWHRPVQAEVLVPCVIDLRYITSVVFCSEASLREAERLCGSSPHPTFAVDPGYFADLPAPTNPVLGFPHPLDFVLTDDIVDKSNVFASRPHRSVFDKSSSRTLTLIARVYVQPGKKAKTTWNPGGVTKEYSFIRSGRLLHLSSISTTELPSERCSVEYRLGEIRWATISFQLN